MTKRVTIFDYGAGNLHSLAKALALPDFEVRIEPDPIAALETDVLVLPGVGAFEPAAECLAPGRDAMRERILSGLPTLGICLGMQLMFDASDEGSGKGLGLTPGQVRRLQTARVPHIGWNTIEYVTESSSPFTTAYFANSYVCQPEDPSVIRAYTTHETDRFASMIAVRRAVGVQFHPEKSSTQGVAFVQRFVREAVA